MRHLLGCIVFLVCSSLHADTLLKWYRPFGDPIDQVKPIIKRQVTGSCMSQSLRIVREDALRCDVAGQIYDPCFVRTVNKNTSIMCAETPWQVDAVELIMQKTNEHMDMQPLDMSRTYPWALELVDGTHCVAVDPGRVFEQMPVRYSCSNNMELMGHLQRCQSTWRILEKTPSGMVNVEVAKAWF